MSFNKSVSKFVKWRFPPRERHNIWYNIRFSAWHPRLQRGPISSGSKTVIELFATKTPFVVRLPRMYQEPTMTSRTKREKSRAKARAIGIRRAQAEAKIIEEAAAAAFAQPPHPTPIPTSQPISHNPQWHVATPQSAQIYSTGQQQLQYQQPVAGSGASAPNDTAQPSGQTVTAIQLQLSTALQQHIARYGLVSPLEPPQQQLSSSSAVPQSPLIAHHPVHTHLVQPTAHYSQPLPSPQYSVNPQQAHQQPQNSSRVWVARTDGAPFG